MKLKTALLASAIAASAMIAPMSANAFWGPMDFDWGDSYGPGWGGGPWDWGRSGYGPGYGSGYGPRYGSGWGPSGWGGGPRWGNGPGWGGSGPRFGFSSSSDDYRYRRPVPPPPPPAANTGNPGK